MECPVALGGAIVQCVSQSNTHICTHTLSKQTAPGDYSSAPYLFSLCLNVVGEGREEYE